MALRNLSKILAILTLSLTVVSPVYAAPDEVTQNTENIVQYTVPGLIRPGETKVRAIVEEKLLSHCNVGFRGGSYTEEQWCSFFARNLLIGPRSCKIKNIKFSAAAPGDFLIKIYVSGETLVVVCRSISETAKLDMVGLRFEVTKKLFFDIDDATIEEMTR